MALMVARGLTVADLDKFTFGMLVNYCRAYDRMQVRARGEDVPDDGRRIQQLQAIAPIVEEQFKNAEISEEEYRGFCEALNEYEGG